MTIENHTGVSVVHWTMNSDSFLGILRDCITFLLKIGHANCESYFEWIMANHYDFD